MIASAPVAAAALTTSSIPLILQSLAALCSISAALIATMTLRAIRSGARAARSSAETAAYNARHVELARLHDHFETDLLFLKFWQLDLATSERYLNTDPALAALLEGRGLEVEELRFRVLPFSPDDPVGTLYLEPYIERFCPEVGAGAVAETIVGHLTEYQVAGIIAECLGPPYSSDSASLLGVYSLVRALSAWMKAHSTEDPREQITEITDVFRRELVLTMSWHRAFVARLFRPRYSSEAFEYFRLYYGLRDEEYTKLFDALALSADEAGLLTAEHRRTIARVEGWLAHNPDDLPMRSEPFPRAEWAQHHSALTNVSAARAIGPAAVQDFPAPRVIEAA